MKSPAQVGALSWKRWGIHQHHHHHVSAKGKLRKGDAYNNLLKVETERAQQQIILTNEQIKLTLLKQEEVKLRIQLLEKQLKD